MKIKAVKHIKEDNDVVAEQNRRRLNQTRTLGINLISSPGSGKTTLLEYTLPRLREQSSNSAVIVGDLETARDAERVDALCVESVQINTGMSCHLYANQVQIAMNDIDLDEADYLFIENVGNMVCPGEFDLGENVKAVLYSFPEGDDKVAKYPTIFRVADIVLLTKADIRAVCDFDMDRVVEDIRKLNTHAPILEISCRTGAGIDAWLEWLTQMRRECIGRSARFVSA